MPLCRLQVMVWSTWYKALCNLQIIHIKHYVSSWRRNVENSMYQLENLCVCSNWGHLSDQGKLSGHSLGVWLVWPWVCCRLLGCTDKMTPCMSRFYLKSCWNDFPLSAAQDWWQIHVCRGYITWLQLPTNNGDFMRPLEKGAERKYCYADFSWLTISLKVK